MARPPSLPLYVRHAFDCQKQLPADLNIPLSKVLDELKVLASAFSTDNEAIVGAVHPYIREIVAKRNISLLREVTYNCIGLDYNLVVDYVFGLPMLGWARHSPVMLQRRSESPRAEAPTRAEMMEENKIALSRAKPSYSPVLDRLAWEKTQKEFLTFSMLGPCYSLAQLSDGDPRLLNRFGILEMHGGATEQIL